MERDNQAIKQSNQWNKKNNIHLSWTQLKELSKDCVMHG
jgi:hypothetical protein